MAGTYRTQYTPTGYGIVSPSGKLLTARYGSKTQAETRIDALENEARREGHKRRPCITCGASFLSEGAHNRMCNGCRSHSAESLYEIGHRRARIGVKS